MAVSTRPVSLVLLSIGLGALLGCQPRQDNRIILMPEQGKMMVNAVVPLLNGQIFGLGIPETIGSREQMMLVNHTEATIHWTVDETQGSVSTTWIKEGHLRYELKIIPAEDYVDLVMTIENQSASKWHGVFAFNCVSPAIAPAFRDSSLERTFVSMHQQATSLATLPRVQGPRPTITVYPTQTHVEELPSFAEAFQATSPIASDDSWLAVISDSGGAYMATTAEDASFLFTNTKFGCIHAAPFFGDIAPHEERTVESRVYFSQGSLQDFQERYESYRMERQD